MTGCACWANTHALGHHGHCCFTTDDRTGWRPDEQVCHIPTPEETR